MKRKYTGFIIIFGVMVAVIFNVCPTMAETLTEKLEAKTQASAAEAPSEMAQDAANGIRLVAESGIIDLAKQKGDIAPDFTLPNALGEDVALSGLLESGPVVILWYRGGWCPYCNLTLNSYQEYLPQIKAKGAQLVAISPETPDNSLTTQQKNNLKFEVLSDFNNNVARKYGVVFKLDEKVAGHYQKFINLPKYNAVDTDELPLAATYIVDIDGTIVYAFLDADYKKRADPEDVLKVLEGLNKG